MLEVDQSFHHAILSFLHNAADVSPEQVHLAITPEGEEVLEIWIVYMERQAENLQNFIQRYHQLKSSV